MNQTHPSIERIVDYLHGELSAAEDAAMHAHLAGCPSCEERRSEEATLTEILRADARARERDLPPAVVARVRAAVLRAPQPMWRSLFAPLRPAVLVPLAAAVALAIYAGVTLRHSATAPTAIAAQAYVDRHAALARISPFAEEESPHIVLSADAQTR